MKWNPFNTIALGLVLFTGLIGCKKEKPINNDNNDVDSVKVVEAIRDTLTPILHTESESNQLILTVDAKTLPIKLIEKISNPEQQIIIKLKDFNHSNLKAFIKPEQSMNVRINQIRMPDNTFDGPFGLSLDYPTTQKGEYWIIISRNLMASGEPTGKFYLRIE